MSDDNTANKNYHRRLQQEYAELNDPRVKGQQALDFWWKQKLAARARAQRSEIPERGEYDPMRRFEAEMNYQQQEADWRYSGRFRR
jgi:hypothetical protein